MELIVCNATIEFGDDNGDNVTTFHCQLEENHEGKHKESGDMGYSVMDFPYDLYWQGSTKEYDLAIEKLQAKNE